MLSVFICSVILRFRLAKTGPIKLGLTRFEIVLIQSHLVFVCVRGWNDPISPVRKRPLLSGFPLHMNGCTGRNLKYSTGQLRNPQCSTEELRNSPCSIGQLRFCNSVHFHVFVFFLLQFLNHFQMFFQIFLQEISQFQCYLPCIHSRRLN